MSSIRYEIQSLRGVSILAVICFHIAKDKFPNGYLGVDIFFVISGYLITQQLSNLKTYDLTRYLREFYFRRLKRIIPSALSILIITLIVTNLLLGSIALIQNLPDATWSNFFLANWYYLKENLNYFAAGNLNLFQHFWSLAIEEQFYLIWPLLFFFVGIRLWISIVLFVGSFGYFLFSNYPNYFYGTPQRAWELLAGALIAQFGWKAAKINHKVIWLLLLLLLAPWQLPNRVASLFAVILAASFITLAQPQVKKGPLFQLGQISYSLYLVHFPAILILREYLTGITQNKLIAIEIVIISLVSLINYRFVEQPLRNFSYRSQTKTISIYLFAVISFFLITLLVRSHYV